MAAPMKKVFGTVARLGWEIQSSPQRFSPSAFIQPVRGKTTNQKYKAPHVAKEQAKWVSQKKSAKAIRKAPRANNKQVLDDVWIRCYYSRPKHSVMEAIRRHKEYAQPAMLDNMEGKIIAQMSLDFTTKKKTRFIKGFNEIVNIPHTWGHGEERKILAFCKELEEIEKALKLGAVDAGGNDLINKIERSEIPSEDYDYVVSTFDVAPDLIRIRSAIKDLFPNKNRGNLGGDIGTLMEKFMNGHRYEAKKTDFEDEGFVQIEFGKLNMSDDELHANLTAFMNTLCAHRSPDLGSFVKEAFLVCPPSTEKFLVDMSPYLPKSRQQMEEKKEAEADVGSDEGTAAAMS